MLGLLAIVFTLAFPSASKADPLVLAGFDLFTTLPGTQVNLAGAGLQPFIGVPLGTFDFGSGPVAVFNTDTIVQRLANATPLSPTVPIEMVALQLMSVNQFNLGAGTDFLFVTLQSARVGGGPASTGTLTITFGPEGIPHGTFDSTLNVAFDIRFGSLTGPIVFSDVLVLESQDVPWSHFPPDPTVLILDVNFFLNGQNQLNDFFPLGPFQEIKPDDGTTVIRV